MILSTVVKPRRKCIIEVMRKTRGIQDIPLNQNNNENPQDIPFVTFYPPNVFFLKDLLTNGLLTLSQAQIYFSLVSIRSSGLCVLVDGVLGLFPKLWKLSEGFSWRRLAFTMNI